MAEEAVRELSRRLMSSQEEERSRLARDLHDDLSQTISLLSIQLTILRQKTKDLEYVQDDLDQLVSDVARLLEDVHRIAHELHPAKLRQLGLQSALKDLCRELAAAHHLQIDFEADNMPRILSDNISVCLYRVTQESLQNVIKHSAATLVQVSIKLEGGEIRLSVSDNGKGFDHEAITQKKLSDWSALRNAYEWWTDMPISSPPSEPGQRSKCKFRSIKRVTVSCKVIKGLDVLVSKPVPE